MNAPPPRSLVDVVAGLTADTVPYLSCDECFDRICAYVDHVTANPQYEDAPLRRHLQACPVCADEAEVLLELRAADLARERGSPPGDPLNGSAHAPRD